MFSCYRWKTEGRKKKGHSLDSLVKEFLSFSYTSLSALNLRSHVPVSASMREAKTTAESYCIDAHWVLSMGRARTVAKAASALCCVSVVIMPAEMVLVC